MIVNLIGYALFTFLECAIIGTAICLTTTYTLRAWHCYKNIKIDPANALKKRDTSFGRTEELKDSYKKIIDMG